MMMTDKTTVSVIKPAEAAEVAALINAAYRGHNDVAGWTHEQGLLAGTRADIAMIEGLLLDGKTTILAMRRETDGKLLGCISVAPMDEATNYISLLAIAPEQQDRGHGRVLLASAETYARERGAVAARMTVIRQREALIAWYERRGYRRTGDIMPFPYEDASVGTPLRDDLELVVLEKFPLRPGN